MGARLFAAGEFTAAGSVQARRVAQWDGSAWASVGAGFSGDVHDLAPIDLGSGPALFATGRFQFSGSTSCPRIARWTGTAWAPLGSGLGGVGWALCEYPTPAGNRLVVGGEFTTAGGVPALRVAMWNGASWAPLGTGIGSQFASQRVYALAMHDDGSGPALYAAGTFPGGVARFDGVQWTVVGGGLVGTPQSLASFDDGQGNRYLLVGGNLDSGPTSALKGWDGASWQDLGLGSYSGGVDRILVRQEAAGPAAYLAGSFEPLAGASSTVRLVARWTPTGIGAYPQLAERVQALAFFDGGQGEQLFAGGMFTRVPTAPVPVLHRVARLDGGGWRPVETAGHALYPDWDAPFQHGQVVRAWTDPIRGTRELYVGGHFLGSADDDGLRHFARWDGVAMQPVPGPVMSPVTGLGEWVRTPGSAPELIVGTIAGTYAFDGASWGTLGSPTAAYARAFAEFTPPGASSPRLIAAGSGIQPSVPGAQFVAQFDGTSWLPMGLGLSGHATTAVTWDAPGALPEGVYVGGMFFSAGGQSAPGIALWDGASWLPLANTGFQQVHQLRVWDDGTGEALYAHTNQGLFRFDGTSWDLLGPVGTVLEPFDDGAGPALYVSDRSRLRNGVIESFSTVTALAPYPQAAHHWVDEHGISQGLYFTGAFETLGGVPAIGLARFWSPCDAVTAYCTAKVNSLGCTPQIGWAGLPSVSGATPFTVTASQVINQRSGLFFFGKSGRLAQPFQGGTVCVRAPIQRTPVRSSGGSVGALDCSGLLSLDFAPYLQGALGPGLSPGEMVHGQWWYRDPLSSFSIGLTDAIEFQVQP